MHRLLLLLACTVAEAAFAATPLHVCATTPDLGDLAARIGGDRVSVTVFVKGTEDPHTLQARPSLIKALNEADLLIAVGLDLEAGWLPAVIDAARQPRVRPGRSGYLDASTAIHPLHDSAVAVDRSAGHVHARGNPHYLLDPANGLRVAAAICGRMAELRPGDAATFEANLAAFRKQVGEALVGEALAGKYDIDKLIALDDQGRLHEFLARTGETRKLGGWLGRLAPHTGAKAIGDHQMWRYFADRFNIDVVDHLEPKPGVTPTTRHLAEVVTRIRRDRIPVILTACFFPPRHAAFVAARTGAVMLPMAHQTGARPEAADYLATIDANVDRLAKALDAK